MSNAAGPRQGRREFEERRIKAKEAYDEAIELMKPWAASDGEYWAETDAAVARCVATMREGRLREESWLGQILSYWGTCLFRCERRQRALALLQEGSSLLTSPADDHQVGLVASNNMMVARALVQYGRLDEAEAACRAALATRVVTDALVDDVRAILVEALLEMKRPQEALEQIRLLERGMQKQREEGREVDIGKEARTWAFTAWAYELLGRDDETRRYCELVTNALNANVRRVGMENSLKNSRLAAASRITWVVNSKREMRLTGAGAVPMVMWFGEGLLLRYIGFLERGEMLHSWELRGSFDALRVMAQAQRLVGNEARAKRLDAEVDETNAIMDGLSDAALVELQGELRAERAAAGGGVGGDGG